jgi:hypothetical protein
MLDLVSLPISAPSPAPMASPKTGMKNSSPNRNPRTSPTSPRADHVVAGVHRLHGIALGVQDQLLLGRQRYEAHVDYF